MFSTSVTDSVSTGHSRVRGQRQRSLKTKLQRETAYIVQKRLEIAGLSLGWFAVLSQFFLMLENRVASVPETVIRFFSFFTILTNIMVALYFTVQAFKLSARGFRHFHSKGALTALTVFILIVGLVYQLVLRQIWEPEGLQRLVDELLHTILPSYALFYWYLYSRKSDFQMKKVSAWLLYPTVYLAFVLLRGKLSGFYPYPFLKVSEIGVEQTLRNVLMVLVLAIVLMLVLVFVGRKKEASRRDLSDPRESVSLGGS